MFAPLNVLSSKEHPVLCPAVRRNEPCPLPRCLFSHDDYLRSAALSAAPPPAAAAAATLAAAAPAPTATPPQAMAVHSRLRDIVAGTKTATPPPTPPPSSSSSVDEQRASKSAGKSSPTAATKGSSAATKTATVKTSPSPKAAPRPSLKRPASSPSDRLKRPKTSASTVMTATTPNITTTTAAAATATTTTTAATAATPTAMTAAPMLTLNPRKVRRPPMEHRHRTTLLKTLHEQLTRLAGYPADDAGKQAVITRSLDIEATFAAEKGTAYRSAMANLCGRYKRASPADYALELQQEAAKAAGKTDKASAAAQAKPGPKGKGADTKGQATTATAAAAASKSHGKGKGNAQPPLDTGLSRAAEIERLGELVADADVLRKHGYVLTPPSEAEMAQARAGLAAAGGWEPCERCSQRFQVFPARRLSDGALTTHGACTYHPGRRQRAARASSATEPPPSQLWTCCQGEVGFARGCSTAASHVFRVADAKRLALALAFAPTPAPAPGRNPRRLPALAVDCEMSYTTLGTELVRLTATAFPSGRTVVDALVRPYGVVLDWNTRFSGVTAAMLAGAAPWPAPAQPQDDDDEEEGGGEDEAMVNPTGTDHGSPARVERVLASPEEARAALHRRMDVATVLIGHGLENDLLHLRMCHARVVDTAVLFPHTRGLPFRNKLRFLVERHLGRVIQADHPSEEGEQAQGHDSAVDARCAAELVRFKIRERALAAAAAV